MSSLLSKILLFSVLLCFVFLNKTKAQEEETTVWNPSRFNFKINLDIPTIVSNKALRKSFTGVYDLNGNLQLRLLNHVYIGIDGNYTGFKIGANKIALIGTECRITTAAFNIGFEKKTNPKTLVYINANYGYNWIEYTKVACNDTIQPIKHNNAFSFRPTAGFCYYAEDNFSLGLDVSYTVLMNAFNPDNICLRKLKTYYPGDYKGNTSYFSIGLTLNFNLRKEMFSNSESDSGDEE